MLTKGAEIRPLSQGAENLYGTLVAGLSIQPLTQLCMATEDDSVVIVNGVALDRLVNHTR